MYEVKVTTVFGEQTYTFENPVEASVFRRVLEEQPGVRASINKVEEDEEEYFPSI